MNNKNLTNMENLEPDRQFRLRILDSKRKIHPRNLSLKSKLLVQNQNDRSVSCKFDDPAAGSKLIKSLSLAQNSASASSDRMSNDIVSSNKDDSMKDFRSPVKEIDMNESLADFKVSVPSKNLTRKEIKPIVKKKRRNRDVKQPSIESSFFRPKTEVQTSFVCILCFKSFKDATARISHMKGCATRNNISTKQLMDAIELQEKQADERKAMGLLVAPPVQPKKTVSRKMISDKDPQLQLALALSMSLHEAQVSEDIEEAHLMAGEPYSPLNGEMSEERRKTLQNFGFTTNKPAVASTSNKSRKKRLAGPTVLQTRTQEERDRITTVRIAEVLMGDEPITQALLNDEKKVIEPVETTKLKSRLLRSYHRVEDRLWDKTQQTPNGQCSYPCNPLESSPCKKIKSESKIEKKTEQKSSEQITQRVAENNTSNILDYNNVTPRQNSKSSESSTDDDDDDDDAVSVKYKADEDSVMDLSKDWRCMLGASYMSDVLVVVKEDQTIHAHQVVFWARCYNIMNDVTKNDSNKFLEIRNRVLWPETQLGSAYAFLEFVYCGYIERHVSIFDHPDMLAEVRALARKYQLKKLFIYLRNKANELKAKRARITYQRFSKSRMSSKSKLADGSDDSSSFSNGAASIYSKETDINSLSTECNNSVIADRSNKEKIPEGKDERKYSRFTGEREKENTKSSSSSLKVNLSTNNNRLSGKRMSEGTSVITATTFISTTENESLVESALSPGEKNSSLMQNNGYLKVIGDKTLDRERSVSPDIFDDSEGETAISTYVASEKYSHNRDYEMNDNDAQIEFMYSLNEEAETKGQFLNKKRSDLSDREISVVNISNKEDRKSLEELEVNLPFVSSCHTRENIKNSLSADNACFNSAIDSSNGEMDLSRRFSKEKGEITLAIEKIQKLNSKTASESDSECETVEPYRIRKRKNPFRLHVTETSSVMEENIVDNVTSELADNGPRKRRNKLSIFEKNIEIAVEKNPMMFNLPTHTSNAGSRNMKPSEQSKSVASTSGLQKIKSKKQNNTLHDKSIIESSQRQAPNLDISDDSIFDLTQEFSGESKSDSDKDTCDTNVDDKDLSMFAKYKRKHSHNSIDKYRTALRNASLATSVSSSKDTGGASSSNNSQIADSELSDPNDSVNSIAFSSKYEYTDPNQSKSHFQKELFGMSSKSKERINISPQILSSAESEDRENNTVKPGDARISDLEIALSDFSSLRYSDNKFNESRANGRSQGERISDKKSASGILDDKKKSQDAPEAIDDVPSCSTNAKLEGLMIPVAQRNLSNEETDTECWIESVVPKNGKRDEEKLTDIYNEETDTEETGERSSQARASHSEIKVNNPPNDAHKETYNSEDRVTSSSSECEITGVFQSSSINFDFVKNVSDEIGLLLKECKTNSHSFHNSSMSQVHNNSEPSKSSSFASTSTHQVHRNECNNFPSHKLESDDDDDDNILANQSFSEAHYSKTKLREAKPTGVKKSVESNESDSSEYEDFIIRKRNSRTLFSSENKSITIKNSAISTPLRCGSVSPEKNVSPLRKFKVKSMSENILKSKSSKTNCTDDSFDEKSRSAGTSSVDHRTSKRNDQTTPPRGVPSENVTPLADYSAMKTPELRRELEKYGFKPQKRHRAKQLLRHIYNELHPLVPVADNNIPSYSNIVSSSDDEMPARKRMNRSNSFEGINNEKCADNAEWDYDTLASNVRTESGEDSDNNEFENYDRYNLSQSGDSERLEYAFRQLIKADKHLHNKVLTYEPLKLEELHSTLKAQGLKCKLDVLMNFLDEQCITFRQMANAKKSRTKRKVISEKNSKYPVRQEKRC